MRIQTVDDAAEIFPKVLNYLNDFYGVEENDRLDHSEIDTISGDDYHRDRDAILSTDPVNKTLIVWEKNIENSQNEISYPTLGEEAGHLIHEKNGRGFYGPLGLSPEPTWAQLSNVSSGDFVKGVAVNEFIGRVSAVNTATEFGGELSGSEIDGSSHGTVDDQYLDALLQNGLVESLENLSLARATTAGWRGFLDEVAHDAAYYAADRQIVKANNDSKLLERDIESNWIKYELDSYLEDAYKSYI